ncbi:hypothetical protein OIE13_05770 [Streptosporangium sp. NBC_01810]|uniref:hypothetical protein n=1 Tax=Streptosporangium sp. NBC_01810 TaxID=2975951 RepID=UPI002DDAE669|nr:hypothetical protein [Streptosporangium sp. NBC_01810]WSA27380.1 hypothetical protein OIE13_05770 [Streptosporangium sp. NBC_01810]
MQHSTTAASAAEFPIVVPNDPHRRSVRSEVHLQGNSIVVRQIGCAPAGHMLTLQWAEELRDALDAAIQATRAAGKTVTAPVADQHEPIKQRIYISEQPNTGPASICIVEHGDLHFTPTRAEVIRLDADLTPSAVHQAVTDHEAKRAVLHAHDLDFVPKIPREYLAFELAQAEEKVKHCATPENVALLAAIRDDAARRGLVAAS